MSYNDMLDIISTELGVSRWRAKCILEEEQDRIQQGIIDDLTKKGYIEPVPGELDQYGDPVFRTTPLGTEIAKKHDGKLGSPVNLNIKELISRYKNSAN